MGNAWDNRTDRERDYLHGNGDLYVYPYLTPVGFRFWFRSHEDRDAFARLFPGRPCAKCQEHYADAGACDEGKPVASPHRSRA